MKSLQEILKQEPVYLNDWSESKRDGVIDDFYNIPKDELEDINILFASYGYENYSGDAWVLFEQEGTLYEVNGSHCSCYGLENQWEPDEVNLGSLQFRLLEGTFGEDRYSGNDFKKELCEFLGVLQVYNMEQY